MKEYMLIDGYNIINNWKVLKEESVHSFDGARIKLLEIMSNYQSYKGINIIVVFDAHYVKNSMEKHETYDGLHVVYTKEYESADNYIERFVSENADENTIIRVATSDSLEQMVILGLGGSRISARELENEVQNAGLNMDRHYINIIEDKRNLLEEQIDEEVFKKLEEIRRRKT